MKAPEVTRQRIYLETMAEVLPGLERKIILDEKAGGLVPLISWIQGSKFNPERFQAENRVTTF